jgi:hypothetical protein
MRPIETIDVSLPSAATGIQKATAAAGDLALAVLLAMMIPLGVMVLVFPLAALARVILAFAGLI